MGSSYFKGHPNLLSTTEKHLANIQPRGKERKEEVKEKFGTYKQQLT